MYLNYNSTTDYPINLETVYKMIGFANKGNAMKTIKSNFTKDEDYKTVFFHKEKNLNTKDLGGRPTEDNVKCRYIQESLYVGKNTRREENS